MTIGASGAHDGVPKLIALIPARLASTRLPNKPLLDIAGKPMIQHVWERARNCRLLDDAVVATPDVAVVRAVETFGGRAVLTADTHRSGTDRLAEAADLLHLSDEVIIANIQGDEPLLEASDIEAVISPLIADASLVMASLMCPCPIEDRDNPDCVKVVCGLNGDALYFSRHGVPFQRLPDGVPVMQHIGLYAYRRHFLRTFAALPPTPLERTESLEQLRALENGYRIRMARIVAGAIGVDTPADLERVRAVLEQSS